MQSYVLTVSMPRVSVPKRTSINVHTLPHGGEGMVRATLAGLS